MDAEDVDSYLFEFANMLTQYASDDLVLGKDESTFQNLLKKHKELDDEYTKFMQSVKNIHELAAVLPGLKQLRLQNKSEKHEQ